MSHPRLSITPAGAIFDKSLEPRDHQVLNLLGCYTDKAGWCRRSQVKMAKQLSCGRASVQRSLERLVEAGWVEKKRPPWSNETGAPSHSYMYRVVLDRDDYVAPELAEEEAEESHAEDALPDVECPPVGTPPAQHDGHPGAQPERARGAHTYVGTKNDPLERPLIERERDARAKDRQARFLVDFEKRWPSAAADDRQRTAYAAEALTAEEQEAAITGIAPFLENLKRLHRRNVPAGWRYLEEKRWTLLEQAQAAAPSNTTHALDSPAGKAIVALYQIAGCEQALRSFMIRNGSVNYRMPVNARLLALAEAPAKPDWIDLTRQQAAAWEEMLASTVTVQSRKHLREHDPAPWPWPPKTDGTIYSGTAPPGDGSLMAEEDFANI